MSNMTKKLYKEIHKFIRWADRNYPDWGEENDNGEWEFGCGSHFDQMYEAAMNIISDVESKDADEKLINALLFVIARDNESENLADELIEHKEWFDLLAVKSAGSKYINAQWQFAKRLDKCDSSENLIYEFIESNDEYTSRMALQTMAEIDAEQAEKYAVKFWNRGKYPFGSYEDEYQKIMVLHVLNTVGSDMLAEYLSKAKSMPYKWLKENAERIINENSK